MLDTRVETGIGVVSSQAPIELILFEHDACHIPALRDAGITSFLVDLEVMGKDLRQLGFDTDISPGNLDALRAMSPIPDIARWCRLNSYGKWSAREVEHAIEAGADVLILPMVRDPRTIETFLKLLGGRTASCVMLETRQALSLAGELDGLGVDHAYFGLNDYRIDSGNASLFQPLTDGTLEAVRRAIRKTRFGFGGLTSMDKGSPLPSIKILEELERLDCDLVFLRRSFKKDCLESSARDIVQGIGDRWLEKKARSAAVRASDHADLLARLGAISV